MSKIVKTELEIEDWFKGLDSSIDLWVTDPPYPFDNQNGAGRFNFVDGEDHMYKRLSWPELGLIYQKMFDISNDGARAYVFCNRDGLCETIELLKNSGWKFRNIIVWDKDRMGMGYHWRNSVEYIIYATKGKPKVYIKGAKNLIRYKKPTANDSIPGINYFPEGTSCKPHQIWIDILKNGMIKGDIIADPFAGSNPMRVALLEEQDLMDKIGKAYTNTY